MTSYRELVRNARAECFERHSGLSDEIFALAVNMNRVAYGVPDSRERTASPDEHGRAFSDLPEREQLDILGRLCSGAIGNAPHRRRCNESENYDTKFLPGGPCTG